jgi:hypothetical protein
VVVVAGRIGRRIGRRIDAATTIVVASARAAGRRLIGGAEVVGHAGRQGAEQDREREDSHGGAAQQAARQHERSAHAGARGRSSS